MSLKQINSRAKALRKARPSMPWHDAQRKAAASLRGGKKKSKVSGTAAVGKRRKSRVSGAVGSTGAVGKTKRRKKKSFFGATTKMGNYVEMGGGMALGMVGTHFLLRPLQHKGIQMISDPKISKYVSMATPYAETALGLAMFLTAKNGWIKWAGVGVASTGVHSIIKTLPLHMHSPAETVQGISGPNGMMQTRIPINGSIRGCIAGLIQDAKGYTKTPVVGASAIPGNRGPVHTPVVGNRYIDNTPVVGELYSDEDEYIFHTNPFFR